MREQILAVMGRLVDATAELALVKCGKADMLKGTREEQAERLVDELNSIWIDLSHLANKAGEIESHTASAAIYMGIKNVVAK